MPPVQSVQLLSDRLVVVTRSGAKTLMRLTVPSSQNTIAKMETWINTWLAANVTECQARVHIFMITPLHWTVGTFNLGSSIPANWWLDA